jgi:acylaminoacyl-peptidase
LDISPSGKYISFIQREDEINTLIILELATMKPTASVKYGEKGKTKKLNICCTSWINDELLSYSTTRKLGTLEGEGRTGHMFFLTPDGKRNDQIWTAYGNYENNSAKRGRLYKGFASLVSVLEKDPNNVMLFLRSWESRPNLVTMNVVSGDTSSFRALPENTMRVWGAQKLKEIEAKNSVDLLVMTASRKNDEAYFLSDNGGDWTPLELTMDGFSGPWLPQSLSDDYLIATAQPDDGPNAPTHVLRYDRAKGLWEDVYKVGFATVDRVITNDEGDLSRVYYISDKPRIAFFDDADPLNQVGQYFVDTYQGFDVSITGATTDKTQAIISVGSSAVLPEYFLYDAETSTVRFLLGASTATKDIEFTEAQYFAYENTDGVTVPGWFQPAPGNKPAPLVVDIHGGPHGPFMEYGFNPGWHIFNQMGYSVYAPNFRGSGGYGENYQKSGYMLWGTGMIDDMHQGAKALVQAGLVDDSTICAYGGSYGGYGTAQSLVRHADFYDCGVVIAGFFDIEALKRDSDIGERFSGRAYMQEVVGDDSATLRSISPIRHLDKIKSPMLLLHGKKDERTPYKGAKEMVAAVKKTDIDFEYKYYDKEGHGNRKLENRVDEWQRIGAFLQRVRANAAVPGSASESAGQ